MTQDNFSGIKFNPNAGAEASVTKAYAEGWVRAVLANPHQTQSKDKPGKVSPNWYMTVMDFIPLADPEDGDSGVGRGIRTWACQPFPIEDWGTRGYDEETLEKLNSTCTMFTRMQNALYSALYPEDVPRLPEKINGTWHFKGEPLENDEEYIVCKQEANDACYAQMHKVYIDPEQIAEMDGLAVYVKVKLEEGQDRPSLDSFSFSCEHPSEDGELVELNVGKFVMTAPAVVAKPEPEEESEEAKPAPKKRKTKAKTRAPAKTKSKSRARATA